MSNGSEKAAAVNPATAAELSFTGNPGFFGSVSPNTWDRGKGRAGCARAKVVGSRTEKSAAGIESSTDQYEGVKTSFEQRNIWEKGTIFCVFERTAFV